MRIPHLLPSGPEEAERYRALSSAYLILKRHPRPGEGLAEKAAAGALKGALGRQDVKKNVEEGVASEGRPVEANASYLARQIAASLGRTGAGVLAYRVVGAWKEPDPYLDRLSPTGMLQVDLTLPHVQVSSRDKEVRFKDSEGKEQTRTARVWDHKALLGFRARLNALPSGKSFGEFHGTASVSRELSEEGEPEEWYPTVERELMSGAAAQITGRFGLKAVQRLRSVLRNKDQKSSAEAYKAARRGDWNVAEAAWTQRLGSGEGDWRDHFDLAVAAELRRDYAAARSHYEKARTQGAGQKEAERLPWEAILRDLSQSLSKPGVDSPAARKWFGRRAAVLPFSDDTNSVDGPDLVRRLVHETLRTGGYAVVPLEEVDARLREQGFSQGGQLRSIEPDQVAKWLGAELILFGHLDKFEQVMLGAYHRRAVSGTLSLWDSKTRAPAFSAKETVSVESASIKKVGERLAGQLAKGLWERMRGKPLASESQLYVQRSLEPLPLRPPQK